LASSIPATLKVWNQSGHLDELLWEDLGVDVETDADEEFAVPIEDLLKDHDFEAGDSKYNAFSPAIRDHLKPASSSCGVKSTNAPRRETHIKLYDGPCRKKVARGPETVTGIGGLARATRVQMLSMAGESVDGSPPLASNAMSGATSGNGSVFT